VRSRLTGLWAHPDFLKLWGAQTISQVGSQVTLIALPLTAILVLDATAFEVAALGAMETLPFLLFALPAGVWVDRLSRRRLMIAADVARAAALVSIPIAHVFGVLALPQLFAVGFATGLGTVFFDVSYLAFLPTLVGRAQISAGNARLQASASVSQIAGPGVGGGLVGLVGAPTAILADAVSFGASGALLGLIRRREEPRDSAARQHVWRELVEGLRYVFGQPYLRTLTTTTASSNFFSSMVFALFILYAVRTLGFSAGLVGVIFMLVNVGGLAGAIGSGRLVRLFGLGPTLVWAAVLGNVALLTIPLAPVGNPLPVFVVGALLGPALGMVFNLNQLSLRQAITPERLMGRMNAVVRFMYWGTMPAGAAAGGALASVIGVRETLFVGAIGGAVAMTPLFASSLRRLRTMPDGAEEGLPLARPPVPVDA
jgi:MFS family permease